MQPPICPACTTVQHADAPRCSWCDWQRPAAGWPPTTTVADPWIGQTLRGSFTVLQRLSTVDALYRVSDKSGRNFFARFCAIHRLATPKKWLARSNALHAVRSRNVARFVDALEVDEYAVFLSDYVEGERLGDRLRRASPFDVDVALSTALQLAVGLESMHAVGLAHARLDPRAVVLHTATRGDLRATICSYGLATGMQPKVTEPAYLPPGSSSAGGPSHDMFAVGAILFEMLTGVSPANGLLEEDVFDIAPSPLRSPSEYNPELHRVQGLDALVQNLTSIEEAENRAMAGVIEDLEHLRTAARRHEPPARHSPKTFTGARQTGVGGSSHNTDSYLTRPSTDARRKAVVNFKGEEHVVRLRGSSLKLRTSSGGNRWGPQSTRFDLADHGIAGTLEAVSGNSEEIWFGTSEGVLGVFEVENQRARALGTEPRGRSILAVDAHDHLVVAGGRGGNVVFSIDKTSLRFLLGERPVAHVSVAERAPRFAIGRLHGVVEIHELVDGLAVKINEFEVRQLSSITLSMDGKQIALSDRETTLVRDVETGARLGSFGQFSELFATTDVMRALTFAHVD